MKPSVQEIKEIRLAHGGGGTLSQRLLHELIIPVLGNPLLNTLDDSVLLPDPGSRLAFTTDSFVVQPLFFPGGDIGRLAVCGTVNDLAMAGAVPKYISLGMILEEGFPVADLKTVIGSVRAAAEEAGVLVVAGDTKVVEKGKADGIFINTAGIGMVPANKTVSASLAAPGDAVLVSGSLGRHGMAVLSSREGLGIRTAISSDVAPLNHLVFSLMESCEGVHSLRDATRGGLAAVLNEIAVSSGVGIELDERSIPVGEDVQAACDLLGFDPLYVANEGVFAVVMDQREADHAVQILKGFEYGRNAARIGRVSKESPGRVTLRTNLGTCRIIDPLSGEQLPRIC
jgi:hydrogenase expression/formation protein HypE